VKHEGEEREGEKRGIYQSLGELHPQTGEKAIWVSLEVILPPVILKRNIYLSC
jgi:hypothetical protein